MVVSFSMKKDVDSWFDPAAILKASGRHFSNASAKRLDRGQVGTKPSDFGDHKPIPDEAMVQLSLGPKDLSSSKSSAYDHSIFEEKE